MATIRSFQNADLPALARVWVEHWMGVEQRPAVSTAVIEQALLSRTFFDPNGLTVAICDAQQDDDRTASSIQGWSHFLSHPTLPSTAILAAICFTSTGLDSCDQLLDFTEKAIVQAGFDTVCVGCVRDAEIGYAGLAPTGHGIGVSSTDSRSASLLSRHNYTLNHSISRLVASTNPYRMPVSREVLQFRRTTRVEASTCLPESADQASAMAHLDIHHYRLVNHLSGEELASVGLWMSDPEAQVMDCSKVIIDLGEIHDRGSATPAELFLIGSVTQQLANQRVFAAETAVDGDKAELIDQLKRFNFAVTEQGHRWEKSVA